MQSTEARKILNDLAEKRFKKFHLEFFSHHKGDPVSITYLRYENYIAIHTEEVIRNVNLEILVKIRLLDALEDIKQKLKKDIKELENA